MTAGPPTEHELDAPSWTRVEGTLLASARAVRRAYDAAFADLGVNLSEASVLGHLRDGAALTQTDLARRVGTGKARMGAWIDALVGKGAVVREADPDDRRVWRVRLTPAGVALLDGTIQRDRTVRAALREGTTHEERARLDALLTLINRNAEALHGRDRS
jgi:DNA-binding MarR family transcriptional regulator